MDGTCSQANSDQRHINVAHIPVDSEEIHLSSKAGLKLHKTQGDKILLTLWLESPYDISVINLDELLEEALISLDPDGSWVGGGGFLSGCKTAQGDLFS